jgi:23S rRNA pseudouridine2605 synthase
VTTVLRAVIEATGLSRRKTFAAIRDGRVSLDGVSVLDPSRPYEGGALTLDGASLTAPSTAKTYLLMHKPPGFITTTADEQGRRTVLDLVPKALRATGLHPVGRLDRDTTGLLVLTNDGDLTQRLSHPSNEVEKEYWVTIDAPVTDELQTALRGGVEIDGKLRRPLRVRRLPPETGFDVAVTIREGRKRQVRRMFVSIGVNVVKLRRMREGVLDLGSLAEGAVRELTADEVALIRGEA